MIVSLLLAATAAFQPPRYSVDGMHLGDSVSSVIAKRGKPDKSNGRTFVWLGKDEQLTIVATGSGSIAAVDIIASAGNQRTVPVPGQLVKFTDTGHVNYVPPAGAQFDDSCGAGLLGSPCEAIRLDRNAELVMNFGMNNGLADWGLSEVILADRQLLIMSGRLLGQP